MKNNVIRWLPFRELNQLQQEMNRLFDATGLDWRAGEPADVSVWTPLVDILESNLALAPGSIDVDDRQHRMAAAQRRKREAMPIVRPRASRLDKLDAVQMRIGRGIGELPLRLGRWDGKGRLGSVRGNAGSQA